MDKLKDEEYQSLDEALNELGLVWENALAYNAEGSPIHKLAEKTKAKTDKMVQDKFGDVLRAQEEAAEAKALEDEWKFYLDAYPDERIDKEWVLYDYKHLHWIQRNLLRGRSSEGA